MKVKNVAELDKGYWWKDHLEGGGEGGSGDDDWKRSSPFQEDDKKVVIFLGKNRVTPSAMAPGDINLGATDEVEEPGKWTEIPGHAARRTVISCQ